MIAPSMNGHRPVSPLRNLLNFVQRNRLLAFGIPVLVLAATAAFVALATPVYQGSATIRIDQEQSNIPVLDVLKTLANGSKIETEMEVLQSRTLAEDVVADVGLALRVTGPRRTPTSAVFSEVSLSRAAPKGEYAFERQSDGRYRVTDAAGRELGRALPGQPILLPGGRVALRSDGQLPGRVQVRVTPFEETVKDFRKELSVSRPNRDADVVEVLYEGSDPARVEAVPNTVARAFIVSRQMRQSAQALSTVHFLNEQLDTLARQLAGAEDSLKDFREQARVLAPDAEAKAQVERLVTMQAERDQVDAERAALAELMTQVTSTATPADSASPLRRLIAFPTLFRNPAASELLRSLGEVEDQRSELLTRRTAADPDVVALTRRRHDIEEQLGSIASTYLQGLTNQVASTNALLARFSGELERIPATEVRFARLQRQAKVLEEIYTMLQTRRKEAQIAAAVQDPSVQVVDPAIRPLKPIKPNVPLSLGLALVVGLVLGVGSAFAREHLDTRVRSREDLQQATSGIPVLGMIPRIRSARVERWRRRVTDGVPATVNGFHGRLIAIHDPRSPISEAYRSLRTNITFSRPEHTPKTLVFTSPAPGDGKSTSAANLAATLAQQGLRCIMLDADLRRGALHEVLSAKREPGLSNVLLGRCRIEDARTPVQLEGGGSFDFVPTGTLPPNPAELLGSERMRTVLTHLEAEYDAVLLDAPPMNLVTDAAVLGTNADGVIVVARAGITARGALEYAVEQLRAVRAPILGSVLNDIDQKRDRYYGGGYGVASGYFQN